MKGANKKVLVALMLLLVLVAGSWGFQKYQSWTAVVGGPEGWCLEITPPQAAERPFACEVEEVNGIIAWRNWSHYPGRYCFDGPVPAHQVARRIATAQRDEIALTIPSKRTMAEAVQAFAQKIYADSSSLVTAFDDPDFSWKIIPNTYQVYWEVEADELKKRLQKESEKWWNRERLEKMWALGLTQREVVILASIVQEETARKDEAADVAGLYLNRLEKGMLLQADPTLKFALGDWTIQRLLDEDKKVQSPYNTYQNPGLPPGPIRIPEPWYIDAVLNATQHPYLYMCARPDASGKHAFARTYREHLKNARAYHEMLNRERIYR